jgi:hypothetical protein
MIAVVPWTRARPSVLLIAAKKFRSVDMRRDARVELVHQPGDRTARRPLSVRPAIASRQLDRHYGKPPLRLGRQRCGGNGIRPLDGADTGA